MIKKEKPGPGQESVWDYPRPPALERVKKTIRIEFGGEIIAQTNQAWRVLETSHPPVYYLPQTGIRMQFLKPSAGRGSFCEWKGEADYWDIQVGDRQHGQVAWSYPDPTRRFAPIKDHLAFYAQKMDACYVDDVLVVPQPGGFYGGWVTPDIVGPFKGVPGSWGW